MSLLTFISFINNYFLITKSVINVEFFIIIKLFNNCESNKKKILNFKRF